jgi:probable F420-dependent oxidoreductase
MRIGLAMIGAAGGVEPQAIKAIAPCAERLNFASLWSPEHVVFIEGHRSRYPYGPMPGNIDLPLFNPLVALAYAAAVTDRIKLATGVCLVPQHNPLILGKEVASLDQLSGGRFMLGVGIGWQVEEFEALGIPWEGRARRTRECIEAMRRLWSEDRASFKGEFVNFANAICWPKPAAGAKLPVLFGGNSIAALRRVAEYGDGWVGLSLDPQQAREKIAKLREMLASYRRREAEVEIFLMPSSRRPSLEELKAYHDAGVTELVITGWGRRTAEEHTKQVEQLARSVVEPAARL